MSDIEVRFEGQTVGSFSALFAELQKRFAPSEMLDPEELADVFTEWAEQDLNKAVQRNLNGAVLKRRTGALARQTTTVVTQDATSITATVQSTSAHSTIHEFGGTIRARTGSYLTVPLPAAKDSRGVARPIRSFSNTFFQRSRKGNLILFRNLGAVRTGAGIEPLFVLKEQVKIPRRPWARPALEETFPILLDRLDAKLSGEIFDRR